MSVLVNLNELEEGMILAEPVLNNYGQTLLNSGVKLNSNHKKILKTWNINSLHIKSNNPELNEEISDELKIIAENSLKSRMIWTPELAIEIDLFNTASKIFADNMRLSL
jgi:hypothetical protein